MYPWPKEHIHQAHVGSFFIKLWGLCKVPFSFRAKPSSRACTMETTAEVFRTATTPGLIQFCWDLGCLHRKVGPLPVTSSILGITLGKWQGYSVQEEGFWACTLSPPFLSFFFAVFPSFILHVFLSVAISRLW